VTRKSTTDSRDPFRAYWQRLTSAERVSFASAIGSTPGYCHQIAYGSKEIELGLADAMVANSGGGLSLEALPLTQRAEFQSRARLGKPPASDAEPQKVGA
jgi:hypothetical protein